MGSVFFTGVISVFFSFDKELRQGQQGMQGRQDGNNMIA
jgi:hypothetical protein